MAQPFLTPTATHAQVGAAVGAARMNVDELTLKKVNDFVDDDLLSCFLWAAGENAVAQPGWESPSVHPLKGIPLPPNMPPLPPSAGLDGSIDGMVEKASGGSKAASKAGGMFGGGGSSNGSGRAGGSASRGIDSDDADALNAIKDLDDSDSASGPQHPCASSCLLTAPAVFACARLCGRQSKT